MSVKAAESTMKRLQRQTGRSKNRSSRQEQCKHQRGDRSACLCIISVEIQQPKGARGAQASRQHRLPFMPRPFSEILRRLSSYLCQEAGRATHGEGKTGALPERDGCWGLFGVGVGRLDSESVFISFNPGHTHHPDMLPFWANDSSPPLVKSRN